MSAFDIARLMALGADWCNAARRFMFALGCIQAQHCHTGTCPTGFTTQDSRRQRAIDVPDGAERIFRFHDKRLKALRGLVPAAGLHDPTQITASHIVRRVSDHDVKLLANLLAFAAPGELLAAERGERPWPHRVFALYWPLSSSNSFQGGSAQKFASHR